MDLKEQRLLAAFVFRGLHGHNGNDTAKNVELALETAESFGPRSVLRYRARVEALEAEERERARRAELDALELDCD